MMAKKKRGAPTKVCPQCNAEVHARTRICPECGYEFPRGPKKSTKKKVQEIAPQVVAPAIHDRENVVLRFALRVGSIQEARKQLEQLRHNPAMVAAIELGGIDEALAELDRVEQQLT